MRVMSFGEKVGSCICNSIGSGDIDGRDQRLQSIQLIVRTMSRRVSHASHAKNAFPHIGIVDVLS